MRLDHLPESSSSESPDTRERRRAGRRPQGASESRGAAAERGPRAGPWRGLRRGTRRQGGMTPNASCWAARSWTGETYLVQRPRGRGAGAEGGRVRPAGGFGSRRPDRPASSPPPSRPRRAPRLAGAPLDSATHTSVRGAHRLLRGPRTPRPGPRPFPPRRQPCLLPGSGWRTRPRQLPPGLPRT